MPLADNIISPSCNSPDCKAASNGNNCLIKMNPSYSKILNPKPLFPFCKFTSKIESEIKTKFWILKTKSKNFSYRLK